jgi:hypothetical protein
MDIHQTNRVIDKFMKRMYDVDVYLTPIESRWKNSPSHEYQVNIIFFPSKFLKNSPDYSEKYYQFLNRSKHEIESDIKKAFKYFGISQERIGTSHFLNIYMSSDTSEYLRDYINELLKNINEYIDTELNRDNYFGDLSNISLNRIDPVMRYLSPIYESFINLRLTYNHSSGFFLSPLLNDKSIKGILDIWLNKKMNVDPQIDFWFEQ